jgi:hypothetical protein
MRSARDALELDHLHVVCHGDGEPWPLSERISALPLSALAGMAPEMLWKMDGNP